MLTILLVFIFVMFISVGLPDSVLGTAWPVMYVDLHLPISFAGYITATVSVGTIISSLMSTRLINKFGTGLITAVSTLLTAVALFGFAATKNPLFFFLLAIPLGIGAGAIDTALNSFVALHYTAAQMCYLQCFYGLGVAVGPFVMSLALGSSGNWRRGYIIVAIIQLTISIISFISLPLWFKVQKKDMEESDIKPRTLSIIELVKTRGVMFSSLSFFMSCALELTCGTWCASYFVNTKNLSPDKAAVITMLYYIGLTSARFFSGVFVNKLGRRRILRISLVILPIAIVLFMLPLNPIITATAIFFIGFGVGPIYPALVHLTPKNFGVDIAQSVMGIQQATTYLGIMIVPWIFGILADKLSTVILPYFLLLLFVLYAVMLISLMKTVNKNK